MSFQGKMNGNQAGDLFAAYNAKAGSAVVDLSRNYNVGDKYSSRIGDGNQIDLALAEINAHHGVTLYDSTNPDYSNGNQLKTALEAVETAIAVAGPLWTTIPDVTLATGTGEFTFDLDTYCYSPLTIAYTVTAGALPAGITLDAGAAGTFTGTTSELEDATGTVTFTATDSAGATVSNEVTWLVTA